MATIKQLERRFDQKKARRDRLKEEYAQARADVTAAKIELDAAKKVEKDSGKTVAVDDKDEAE